VIISRLVFGYRFFPITRHQRRIVLTAKVAVSRSVPTPTHPAFVGEVVYAVRNGPAQLRVDEVMNINELRATWLKIGLRVK
jgi:hypothetical protein